MAVIEGIGDEVLYFFTIVAIVSVTVIAWLSTNTTERPLLRTVLILERHQPRAVNAPNVPFVQQTEPAPAKPPDGDPVPSSKIIKPQTIGSTSDANVLESSSDHSYTNHVPVGVRRRNPVTGDDSTNPSTSTYPGLYSQDETKKERDNQDNGEGSTASQLRIVKLMDGNADDNKETPEGVVNTAETHETTKVENKEREDETEASDGTVPVPTIRINLKYLNDDLKSVEGSLEEQVGEFKKRHFSPELSAQNIVRLVFNGKLLGQDTLTLGNYGLHDNCVVHCLVHQQRAAPNPTNSSATSRSASPEGRTISHHTLSNILLVILSVLLGVAWYGRYQYAQWYTATTTVALVGLTGIFSVFLIGIYIPDTAHA